jgi:anti-sigma factor RsiW
MAEHLDRQAVRRYLAAFADGELDVERNLQVLEQLAMDPQHTNRVVHQEQLREAVGRAMAEPREAPAALRQKVASLAEEGTGQPAAGEDGPSPRGLAGRIADWWHRPGVKAWSGVVAAAAVVLAAVTLWPVGRGPAGSVDQAGLLSQAKLGQFTRRHVQCTQGLAELQNHTAYPKAIGQLPATLRQRLDHPVAGMQALDLSPLGYRFEAAGDCHIPGRNAAHIIYRAEADTGRSDALSLWLRPATGQLAIEPGKLYDASGPQASHPILMWRTDGMVYYLVGDGPSQTREVARFIRRQAPPDRH